MNAAANALERTMEDPKIAIHGEITNPSIQTEGADPSGEEMIVRPLLLLLLLSPCWLRIAPRTTTDPVPSRSRSSGTAR